MIDKNCLQYSHTQNECRLWPYIVLGHEVTNKDVSFMSGWNPRKLRELGLSFTDDSMESGCKSGQWIRPKIHWYADSWLGPVPPETS